MNKTAQIKSDEILEILTKEVIVESADHDRYSKRPKAQREMPLPVLLIAEKENNKLPTEDRIIIDSVTWSKMTGRGKR